MNILHYINMNILVYILTDFLNLKKNLNIILSFPY